MHFKFIINALLTSGCIIWLFDGRRYFLKLLFTKICKEQKEMILHYLGLYPGRIDIDEDNYDFECLLVMQMTWNSCKLAYIRHYPTIYEIFKTVKYWIAPAWTLAREGNLLGFRSLRTGRQFQSGLKQFDKMIWFYVTCIMKVESLTDYDQKET